MIREAVYVGLGSNLLDPVRQLIKARRALARLPQTEIIGCSSLYRTAPVGGMPQPDYVNAVCELATDFSPSDLLANLRAIERQQGRIRTGEANAPRTLDLDVLLIGETMIDTHELVVPHPRMHERGFVVFPLLELAGDIQVPGYGSLEEIASRLPDQRVIKMEQAWDIPAKGEA